MSFKKTIVAEFELRVFDESYTRIYRCLSMIRDEDLWRQPQRNVPSIGNMILHLCGNARQWILSGLGGKPDNRDRDQEFVPNQKIKKSEMIFLLENLKMNLRQTISDLPEEELAKELVIQGFNVSGYSAIIHVLEHFSYHTGQITLLTKLWSGSDTGFYSGLDLNLRNLPKN
ncbi:MAG: DinB family protein [Bacteroidota bacterium]|jgi:uncharacterized damage-inducible protein DinB